MNATNGELEKVQIDFDILDRFHAFGAEIVRLALLTPAIFAFLVTLVAKDNGLAGVSSLFAPHRGEVALAVASLALAILFGLAYRYVAIDALSSYVQGRRATFAGNTEKARKQKRGSDLRFRICAPLLAVGCVALTIGAGTLLHVAFLVLVGQ